MYGDNSFKIQSFAEFAMNDVRLFIETLTAGYVRSFVYRNISMIEPTNAICHEQVVRL